MNTPLNPDALVDAVRAYQVARTEMHTNGSYDRARHLLSRSISAYLAAAQPVVNSVEVIPAKMRMLAWEGGEIEVGEIPEGHVLVGFEMATDRAWSMADKVTIHIERPEVKP